MTLVELGLSGKRAIVTGASEGIGRAVVLELAREGCNVCFCARSRDALDTVAAEVRELGSDVLAVPLVADMSELDQIEAFVGDAASAMGGIDIVVNNAGASAFGPFTEISDERWIADIQLKLLGYVRVCRSALPSLVTQGGRIINIAGNAGKQPLPYHLPGGASNAGVINFTVALAAQVAGSGVHVIAVAPGPVWTARFEKQITEIARQWDVSREAAIERFTADLPLRRIPSAEEVADTVVFLASERAAYMTGTTVTIDGGITRGI